MDTSRMAEGGGRREMDAADKNVTEQEILHMDATNETNG